MAEEQAGALKDVNEALALVILLPAPSAVLTPASKLVDHLQRYVWDTLDGAASDELAGWYGGMLADLCMAMVDDLQPAPNQDGREPRRLRRRPGKSAVLPR
jgi:hypothetical protein